MNEVNTKIEEAQKAGEVVGAEAGNRMHQEVYGPTTGATPHSFTKDGNGNEKHSDLLPGLHIDNKTVEGAIIGANVGLAASAIVGAGVFGPEAVAAGAAAGAWIAHNK